jgi:hemoglobin
MSNAPQQPAEISEAMIHALVHGFYDRVRADAELGPIFDRVIGDDWDAHLAKMCDFWSSVMLTSGRYKGNPMVAHLRLKMVRPGHFARWLALFGETAEALTPPVIAAQFRARSELIARSLQQGMFFRPQTTEEKSS